LSVLIVIAAIAAILWACSRAAVLFIERAWPRIGADLRINGLDVHAIDVPAGPVAPALVLIHGASGNVRDPLAALQASLGGRHRLIAVDRPGNGYSARGPREMSDPARQAGIIAATLDRLGVRECLVLGHSLGAAVALALALARPDLVKGLVLVAPATHPWPGGISRRTRFFALSRFGRTLAEFIVVPLGLWVIGPTIRVIFRPCTVPASYARRIGAGLAIRPASFVANCRDIADLHGHLVRLSGRYHQIRVPAEIVTGDRDAILAPAIHAYGLARDLPGARLTVLTGAGHMPHWSRTAEIVAAVERLSARVEARLPAAAE
jgi:pimeloyl-ACP methyl ester carboxylesterase